MKRQKQALEDFKYDALPKTRAEQFGDCVKVRYTLLFYIGAMLFAFTVPLIVIMFLKDHFLVALYVRGEDVFSAYASYIATAFAAFEILGITVFGVGVAGVMHVVKMLLWGEGVFFISDFRDGVKANGGKTVLYFFVGGLVRFLLALADNMGGMIVITTVTFGFSAVFVLPVLFWCVAQSAYYKLKVSATVKNALGLYIKTAPKTLGMTVLTLAPLATLFINSVLIKYLVFSIVWILALPLLVLGWMCLTLSAFDKFINAENYPHIAYKGLFRADKA